LEQDNRPTYVNSGVINAYVFCFTTDTDVLQKEKEETTSLAILISMFKHITITATLTKENKLFWAVIDV
jgi:hypothetical protein